jgi:hypothetical protein
VSIRELRTQSHDTAALTQLVVSSYYVYTVHVQMWWLRTEDDMFTIRLGLIVQEQSYAPHEPIFKVSLLLLLLLLLPVLQHPFGGSTYSNAFEQQRYEQ